MQTKALKFSKYVAKQTGIITSTRQHLDAFIFTLENDRLTLIGILKQRSALNSAFWILRKPTLFNKVKQNLNKQQNVFKAICWQYPVA